MEAADALQARRRGLSPGVSVYLDLLRLAAALAVFADHASKFMFGRFRHGYYNLFLAQGGSAVAVFFVLSGFVISFVTARKEMDWRSYVTARLSRVYSVALLALLVTVVADYIGGRCNAQHYMDANNILHFYQPASVYGALRLASFTNELWFSHVIFGTDEPYWSLGFEVIYYVFFGLLMFVPGRLKYVMVLAWFVVAGPKIALYLPLWLIGVGSYQILARRGLRVARGVAGFAFVLPVVFYIVLWRLLAVGVMPMYQPASPGQALVSFGFFTVTGLLVGVNILAFDALAHNGGVWPDFIARWIRWLAGASFTLYLVHQPLIFAAAAIFPATAKHGLDGGIACIAILLLVLVLAEAGERRKRVFSRAIGRGLQRLVPGISRARAGDGVVMPEV